MKPTGKHRKNKQRWNLHCGTTFTSFVSENLPTNIDRIDHTKQMISQWRYCKLKLLYELQYFNSINQAKKLCFSSRHVILELNSTVLTPAQYYSLSSRLLLWLWECGSAIAMKQKRVGSRMLSPYSHCHMWPLQSHYFSRTMFLWLDTKTERKSGQGKHN